MAAYNECECGGMTDYQYKCFLPDRQQPWKTVLEMLENGKSTEDIRKKVEGEIELLNEMMRL